MGEGRGGDKGDRGDRGDRGDKGDREDKGDRGEQISTLIPQDKIDRPLLFPIPYSLFPIPYSLDYSRMTPSSTV